MCCEIRPESLRRLASIHTHASWTNARTLTHNRARCVDVNIRPRGSLAAAPLFLHTSPSAMHSCKLVPCMTSLTVPAAHLNMTAKAAHRMTPTAGISRVSVYTPHHRHRHRFFFFSKQAFRLLSILCSCPSARTIPPVSCGHSFISRYTDSLSVSSCLKKSPYFSLNIDLII